MPRTFETESISLTRPTAELFYRINLGKRFAIPPDVQILIDPALNPEEDFVGVFGLRGRLVL